VDHRIPEAGILVFLEDSDHSLEPEVIDEMVCAELPDPSGELTDIVKSQIIHGPCDLDSNTACIVDGECSKKYPRPFCDETSVGGWLSSLPGGTILPSSAG
jgi:hypothetical protein